MSTSCCPIWKLRVNYSIFSCRVFDHKQTSIIWTLCTNKLAVLLIIIIAVFRKIPMMGQYASFISIFGGDSETESSVAPVVNAPYFKLTKLSNVNKKCAYPQNFEILKNSPISPMTRARPLHQISSWELLA